MLKEKIGVVGAGKIGAAIMRGIVRAGLAGKDQVMASDVSEQLRDAVVKELDIKATADNGVLCDFADIVILAVKPQIVDPVAKEIAKKLGSKKLLVSVAAGRADCAHRGQFGKRRPRRARDAEYRLCRRRRRGGFRRRQSCHRGRSGKSRRYPQ